MWCADFGPCLSWHICTIYSLYLWVSYFMHMARMCNICLVSPWQIRNIFEKGMTFWTEYCVRGRLCNGFISTHLWCDIGAISCSLKGWQCQPGSINWLDFVSLWSGTKIKIHGLISSRNEKIKYNTDRKRTRIRISSSLIADDFINHVSRNVWYFEKKKYKQIDIIQSYKYVGRSIDGRAVCIAHNPIIH